MDNKIIYQKNILHPDMLWERPVHYYKNMAGKVFILAGSGNEPNAAIISCEAIFRSGTGILTLGFPDKIKYHYKDVFSEAMLLPLSSTYANSISHNNMDIIYQNIESNNVSLIGPGLSKNSETLHLVWEIINNTSKPIVIAADGVSALIEAITVMKTNADTDFIVKRFKDLKGKLIIICSLSELKKIFSIINAKGKIKNNSNSYLITEVSMSLNSIVVLSEKDIIISDGLNVLQNKGISNYIYTKDLNYALSGMIASFIAQNPDNLFDAIATAAYIFEYSFGLTEKIKNNKKIMAADLLRKIPEAISELE